MAANAKGGKCILFDQQHGHALFAIDAGNDRKNFFHHLGSQAQRRLIQQNQTGLTDQSPGDGQHLLFAARQIPCSLLPPFGQTGEILKQSIKCGLGSPHPTLQGQGGGDQIFFHREVFENMATFAHVGNATACDQVGCHPIELRVRSPNLTTAHLAFFKRQQARHRFERGGLARAVRAQQCHHGTFGHLQGKAAQHLYGVVVHHLNVFDAQCGV